MSAENVDDAKKNSKISRRNFVVGVGAGVIVAAIAGAGAESMLKKATILPVTSTETGPTSTVTGPTTTVTGPTTTKTSTVTGPTSTVTNTVTSTVTTTPTPVVAPPTYGELMTLNVNGADYSVYADYRWTLLDVIRDKLNLGGTKRWCDNGECGSCTVLIGGKPILSCMTLAVEAQGKSILTIEGVRPPAPNAGTTLNYIQQAFVDNDGTQCDFCTPGIIMETTALLAANPHPTSQQVKDALSGNLCRCGCYPQILNSVLAAAKVGP